MSTTATQATTLQEKQITVDGKKREYTLYVPPNSAKSAPVLLCFPGNSQDRRTFARKYAYHTLYQDAIVVYLQGLPGNGSDASWQYKIGDDGNRDVKFFNAVLEVLEKEYSVNDNAIFVHGWSRGGEFIYNVLLPEYPTRFRAIICASSHKSKTTDMLPTTVVHIAGTKDEKVGYSAQEKTVIAIRKINQSNEVSDVYATCQDTVATRWKSDKTRKTVLYIVYKGPHEYPNYDSKNANCVPAIVVRFLKTKVKR